MWGIQGLCDDSIVRDTVIHWITAWHGDHHFKSNLVFQHFAKTSGYFYRHACRVLNRPQNYSFHVQFETHTLLTKVRVPKTFFDPLLYFSLFL